MTQLRLSNDTPGNMTASDSVPLLLWADFMSFAATVKTNDYIKKGLRSKVNQVIQITASGVVLDVEAAFESFSLLCH